MDDTQGYPYFIQLYGDRLWKGSKERTITLDEFHQLRPAILRDLDDLFFEARYQRATPRERAVLHAIGALGGESATVKQLIDKPNLRNNEVQPLIGIPGRQGPAVPPKPRGRGVHRADVRRLPAADRAALIRVNTSRLY
jgi:hypothetical protein